jgi:hypothetical protein
LNAEKRLQILHRPTHRGNAYMGGVGRLGEAAVVHYGFENLQRFQTFHDDLRVKGQIAWTE